MGGSTATQSWPARFDFTRDAHSKCPLCPRCLRVVTTAVANWLQTIGQAGVRAQDAAIIYSLDRCTALLVAAARRDAG